MQALDTGIAPADMFTKMRWEQQKFHDEWKHMFGESTYQHPLDDDADG
jgi:hypothetical protein